MCRRPSSDCGRDVAHLRHLLDVGVEILLAVAGLRGEDHQTGGVGDLRLAVGSEQEFRADLRVVDDEECPGLKAQAGRREDEGFFERGPVLRRNLARRVVLLRGVAPVQLVDELVTVDDFHGSDWLSWGGSGGEAAVGQESGTGDVGGLGAGEVGDEARDFVHAAVAPEAIRPRRVSAKAPLAGFMSVSTGPGWMC